MTHAQANSSATVTGTNFKNAERAVSNQQWSLAIRLFEKELAQSPSPQLHFNLGQLFLKTNQIEKSKYHFNKLQTYPKWQLIAFYYLGLIADAQNLPSIAKQHFAMVINNSNSPNLVERSQQALNRLNQTNKNRRDSTLKNWSIILDMSLSQESNPSALTDEQVLNSLEDQSNSIWLYSLYQPNSIWQFYGQLYSQSYQQYDFLNFSQIMAGGQHLTTPWLTTNINGMNISGNSIEYQQIGISAEVPLGYFSRTVNNLTLAIQNDYIFASSRFDYLTGQRIKTTLGYRLKAGKGIIQTKLFATQDDRKDLTTEAGDSSYSPFGAGAHINYQLPVTKKVNLNFGIQIEQNQWPTETDVFIDSNTNIETTLRSKRKNQTIRLHTQSSYKVLDIGKVYIQLQHEQSDESIDLYDYENFAVTFGFQAEI